MGNREHREELGAWIARVLATDEMDGMGHNQRAEDGNLGLGWVYYALGRLVRPGRAVVIGSFRGFVPAVLARALGDNAEGGEVIFIDPSLADDFWKDAAAVRAHFEALGLDNVRHHLMTTQQFAASQAHRELGQVGLVFVDGYHTREQALFDYRAFADNLAPRGLVLFHDSLVKRRSNIYGTERGYDVDVHALMAELRQDPGLQLLDLPYGTGLTLLRKVSPGGDEPLWEKPPRPRRRP